MIGHAEPLRPVHTERLQKFTNLRQAKTGKDHETLSESE